MKFVLNFLTPTRTSGLSAYICNSIISRMRKNGLAGLLFVAACSTGASAGSMKELQGVVELDMVTLAFEVSGRIEAVSADEGDRLEGKVVLATLDESMARPERDARAAELDASRAQLALIEAGAREEDIRATQVEIDTVVKQQRVLARQKDRQLNLAAKGAAPSAVLDDFDAQATTLAGRRAVLFEKLKTLRSGARIQEIEAARAKVAALEATLRALDVRLTRFRLVYEGTADVLEVYVNAGEVVAPGAPAFSVADLNHPYVDVFVPQAALAGIKIGAPMTVRVDAVPHTFSGQVERVGYKTEFTPRFLFSEKERANLVVRVRVRVDDPKHELPAGVPAFVSQRFEET